MSTTSQETVDARAWCIGNLKATKSMQQIQIYMEICQEWVKAAKMLQDPSTEQKWNMGIRMRFTSAAVYFAVDLAHFCCTSLCMSSVY